MGGVCSISPVRSGSAAATRAASRADGSPRSVTRPSASSVSVDAPNATSAWYSLSPSASHCCSLSASPRHTASTPVASGSRVPAWPAEATPSRRRTRCTTWKLVGPAGLSMTRTPSAMEASGARRRLPPLLVADLPEQPVDLVPLGHALVVAEAQVGGVAQLEAPGHLPLEVRRRRLQPREGALALLLLAVDGDPHRDLPEVRRHPGPGDGHEAGDARVLEAAGQQRRQLVAELLGDPRRPIGHRHRPLPLPPQGSPPGPPPPASRLPQPRRASAPSRRPGGPGSSGSPAPDPRSAVAPRASRPRTRPPCRGSGSRRRGRCPPPPPPPRSSATGRSRPPRPPRR